MQACERDGHLREQVFVDVGRPDQFANGQAELFAEGTGRLGLVHVALVDEHVDQASSGGFLGVPRLIELLRRQPRGAQQDRAELEVAVVGCSAHGPPSSRGSSPNDRAIGSPIKTAGESPKPARTASATLRASSTPS